MIGLLWKLKPVYGEDSHLCMNTCAPVCTLARANEHSVHREKLVKEIKTLLWSLMSLSSAFTTLPLGRCLLSVTARQLLCWAPVPRDCVSPSAKRVGACSWSRKSKFSDASDQELTRNTASGSVTRFQIKFKWLHFTWLSEHVLSDIYKLHLIVSGIKTVENNSHMENSMLNQSFMLCLLHVSTLQHSQKNNLIKLF